MGFDGAGKKGLQTLSSLPVVSVPVPWLMIPFNGIMAVGELATTRLMASATQPGGTGRPARDFVLSSRWWTVRGTASRVQRA